MPRVAKFKRPHLLNEQKRSEGNQKLRPGCPPDYQIFCERIDPKMFIPTNLSSYLSLINENSSVRTNITSIILSEQNENDQNNDEDNHNYFKFWLSSDYQLWDLILLPCMQCAVSSRLGMITL